MSYYSLPLERHNAKIPEEYCYLVISKYTENHFKPSNGKKLTQDEIKNKKDKLLRQEKTIKQLDSKHYNLFNNSFRLESIYDSSFVNSLDDSNKLIYKIKPLASSSENQSYSRDTTYKVNEFEVIAQLHNKVEVINQIYNDGLLREFSATVFDSLSYGNEGYNLRLYDYFKLFKDICPNYDISLSDIMLTKDYTHAVRNKFTRSDTYELTRINVRYLLSNGLIKCIRSNDYYKDSLIIGLIECGLSDVALHCIDLLEGWEIESLQKDKDLNITLRKWFTNSDVKAMVEKLNITLDGITLVIKNNYQNVVATKNFKDIGEAKTYVIKNYDVSFDEVMKKDLCDIRAYDEDYDYSFEIS